MPQFVRFGSAFDLPILKGYDFYHHWEVGAAIALCAEIIEVLFGDILLD